MGCGEKKRKEQLGIRNGQNLPAYFVNRAFGIFQDEGAGENVITLINIL